MRDDYRKWLLKQVNKCATKQIRAENNFQATGIARYRYTADYYDYLGRAIAAAINEQSDEDKAMLLMQRRLSGVVQQAASLRTTLPAGEALEKVMELLESCRFIDPETALV